MIVCALKCEGGLWLSNAAPGNSNNYTSESSCAVCHDTITCQTTHVQRAFSAFIIKRERERECVCVCVCVTVCMKNRLEIIMPVNFTIILFFHSFILLLVFFKFVAIMLILFFPKTSAIFLFQFCFSSAMSLLLAVTLLGACFEQKSSDEMSVESPLLLLAIFVPGVEGSGLVLPEPDRLWTRRHAAPRVIQPHCIIKGRSTSTCAL